MNLDISPMKLVANIMRSLPESQLNNLQPGILHMFSSCQTIDYKLIAEKPVDVDDELGKIIIKCISAFQVIDGPLGRVIGVEHKIDLNSDKPIKMKSYRYSPEDCDFLKSQVDNMLSQGLIKRADSPYSAPVMVVRQPFRESQPRRLVIDYRMLNSFTISVSFAMPHLDDLINKLGQGYSFYSITDFKSAYWQIPLREEDQLKCAFTTPQGTFVPTRMMFGLSNAPATFQNLANKVADKVNSRIQEEGIDGCVTGYIDDFSTASKTKKDHYRILEILFGTCIEMGLKISLDKCQFLKEEIKYLGYIINSEGKRPDPRKLIALSEFPEPHDVHSIRAFIGIASWYRKFILGFSSIARPLIHLTKKDTPWDFNEECKAAFKQLKEMLVSPPILAHFVYGRITRIYVDASLKGLGIVIAQVDEQDREHLVECASRSLTDPEKRMHINVLEGIALHWALVIKFYHMIAFDSIVEVYTDSFTFKSALTKIKPSARFWNLIHDLQGFKHITYFHIPGEKNSIADSFSRYPVDTSKYVKVTGEDLIPPQDTETCFYSFVDPMLLFLKEQHNDSNCQLLINILKKTPVTPAEKNTHLRYSLCDGVLFKLRPDTRPNIKDVYKYDKNQIVVPALFRHWVCYIHHDGHGHFYASKTLELIQRQYFWSTMVKDVTEYVKNCTTCIAFNRKTSQPSLGFLHPRTVPVKPFSFICADFMGPLDKVLPALRVPKDLKNIYILVVVDYTTRYTLLIPVPNTKTTYVINALEAKVFSYFGVCDFIYSDNHKVFKSRLMRKFLHKHGMIALFSHAYYPSANGLVERSIQTTKQVLSKLVNPSLTDWEDHVNDAQFSINNTRQQSLKYSPSQLLYGFTPKIPKQGSLVSTDPNIPLEARFYRLDADRLSAMNNLKKAQDTQKRLHDKDRMHYEFQIGDRVVCDYHHLHIGKAQKFIPRFEGDFIVIDKDGDNYVIEKIFSPTRIFRKSVHISQIKPASKLTILSTDPDVNQPANQSTQQTDDDASDSNDQSDKDQTPPASPAVVQTPPAVVVQPIPPTLQASPTIAVRRSNRTRRKPAHLADYDTSSD